MRHLRRAGDRVELARALSDLGEALDTLGKHAEARELSWIAMAETEASGSGATPIPVDWEDGDAGDRRSVLSDSELRVAELAAKGHTNREISAILYITVSTVEQHLTRVYRKLGMRSRADLPHRLPQRTGAGPRAFEARG
ncbi:helix-turn-helix transcriptional regulator [Lentzea guizhouensis]|uniref:helix-turn-helix transcriptional regulator n=1 Tax=Lentzea guizhouensis TaxID=1586287 RepID=UPI001F48D9A4|nr:helix-turn-helix transcriptional regulator [Lentzea guizhouensis]